MSSRYETKLIVPIVEGEGELEAVPILIERILWECLGAYDFTVGRPKRLKKTRALSDLPRFLDIAAKEPGCKAAIIMFDCDEQCALEYSELLAQEAINAGSSICASVVCPKSEFESWFIASIESIRGGFGGRGASILTDAEYPGDPERIRGAKKWLSDRMLGSYRYKPTSDQAPLTNRINIELTKGRSRSFQRMYHAVEEVVGSVRSGHVEVTPRISH